jgi:hypothetical protein
MLRGQALADNYSVELYLKNVDGFNLAINKCDPRTVNFEVA